VLKGETNPLQLIFRGLAGHGRHCTRTRPRWLLQHVDAVCRAGSLRICRWTGLCACWDRRRTAGLTSYVCHDCRRPHRVRLHGFSNNFLSRRGRSSRTPLPWHQKLASRRSLIRNLPPHVRHRPGSQCCTPHRPAPDADHVVLCWRGMVCWCCWSDQPGAGSTWCSA